MNDADLFIPEVPAVLKQLFNDLLYEFIFLDLVHHICGELSILSSRSFCRFSFSSSSFWMPARYFPFPVLIFEHGFVTTGT